MNFIQIARLVIEVINLTIKHRKLLARLLKRLAANLGNSPRRLIAILARLLKGEAKAGKW